MKRPSLNQNQLKYLAIIAMTIDHIAWAFVPTESLLGQAMHFVGRLTAPTMAYFIVEGYLHTRSVQRYALRLAIFALLSWPAFTLFDYHALPIQVINGQVFIILQFGVIYTLLLSLLAVWLWDTKKCPLLFRVLGVAGLMLLSVYGDWMYWMILFALCFFIGRAHPIGKWVAFCAAGLACVVQMMLVDSPSRELFQLGVLLAPVVVGLCYNGESGSRKPLHKWFFYLYYPAHMLVLAAVCCFIISNSSSVKQLGLFNTESGTPILPMSWSSATVRTFSMSASDMPSALASRAHARRWMVRMVISRICPFFSLRMRRFRP